MHEYEYSTRLSSKRGRFKPLTLAAGIACLVYGIGEKTVDQIPPFSPAPCKTYVTDQFSQNPFRIQQTMTVGETVTLRMAPQICKVSSLQ